MSIFESEWSCLGKLLSNFVLMGYLRVKASILGKVYITFCRLKFWYFSYKLQFLCTRCKKRQLILTLINKWFPCTRQPSQSVFTSKCVFWKRQCFCKKYKSMQVWSSSSHFFFLIWDFLVTRDIQLPTPTPYWVALSLNLLKWNQMHELKLVALLRFPWESNSFEILSNEF